MSDKPLRALRRFCLECQGGHAPSVVACKDVDCFFYALRSPCEKAETPTSDAAPVRCEEPCAIFSQEGACFTERPIRVIRRFCMACGGSRADVRTCDAGDACPLWSYRFGVLPATFKRVLARQRRTRAELSLPGLPRR